MSFEDLIEKVKQAESALEASERRTASRWKQLRLVWKENWTPGRIVIVGLASGFMTGYAKPLQLAGSGGLLNLVTAVSGLFASSNAQVAADQASEAAGTADTAGSHVAAPTSSVDAAPFDASAR